MQPTTEMQFGRDDSPSVTIASAFACGQVTITVQNTEVPGQACDNELTMAQTIQLRDFLNRHIDSFALSATGSLAQRAADDPTQLAAEELLLPLALDAIAPALPGLVYAAGDRGEGRWVTPGSANTVDAPAGTLHLVWSLDKTECVGFYDQYQADWASAGIHTGSCVSGLAMAIREDQARQHTNPCPILPRTTVTFF